jgi:succinate dehydrogenase / fumarate reductase membrane anchor subunit
MAVVLRRENVATPRRSSLVERNIWPWILQRITGIVLVVLMAIHIVVNHFGNLDKVGKTINGVNHSDLIIFNDVAYRLSMAFWWVIDVALLVFVLFHGFNGIRNIALDMGLTDRAEKAVTAVLVVVGVIGFGFGLAALIAFRIY